MSSFNDQRPADRSTSEMKNLTIILPIHNAASHLEQNVHLLVELLPQLTDAFQLIIVDDGSSDGSDFLATRLEARFPQVELTTSARHQGEKAAIARGLKLAKFDLIFIQAAETIEESKIQEFISSNGMPHVDPEPEKESVSGETSESAHRPIAAVPVQTSPPAEKSSLADSPQQADDQRLVQRLMDWGIALRNYKGRLRDQVDVEQGRAAKHSWNAHINLPQNIQPEKSQAEPNANPSSQVHPVEKQLTIDTAESIPEPFIASSALAAEISESTEQPALETGMLTLQNQQQDSSIDLDLEKPFPDSKSTTDSEQCVSTRESETGEKGALGHSSACTFPAEVLTSSITRTRRHPAVQALRQPISIPEQRLMKLSKLDLSRAGRKRFI